MNTITQTPLKVIGAAAIATLFLTGAPVARAQSNSAVVLTPGTVIPVKLDTELSSNQSHAGDTFTATVDDTKPAYRSIMQGATVRGVVKSAVAQSGSNPGTLSLGFTRLTLSDGRSYAISGGPTSLDTKNLTTDSNGRMIAKNTTKDQKLTYAGIGAGAGLLVGLLTGHHSVKIEDILLGAAAGYGTAALTKGPQQVHDVDLTPGTDMGVLLDSSTRYYHRGSPVVVHHTTKKVVTKTHYMYYKGHYYTLVK